MPTLSGSDVQVKISTTSDAKGIDDTKKKLGGLNDAAVSASAGFARGFGIAAAAAGAFGIGAIKMAGDIEQSEIAFTTLLGSAEKAGAFLDKLKQDAAKTPFELSSLVDMSQRLIGAGINAETARTTVLQLGDALSATGAGSAEMTRIGNTIAQVFGKGKADAVDFKEIVNAGWVSVKKDVADGMGLTMAQFEDAVSAGKVGFEDLSKVLGKVTGEGGKYFNAMANQSTSINGLFSTLKDTVVLRTAEIGAALAESFNLSGAEGNIAKLTVAVEQFANYFIGTVIPFIQNNQGVLVALGLTVATLVAPAFIAWAGAALTAAAAVLAATWPVLALIAVGTALYLAWNNNWLGIRDITNSVVVFFQTYVWPVLQGIFNAIRIAVTTLYNVFNLIFQSLKIAVMAAVQYIANTALGGILINGFMLVKNNLTSLKAAWDAIWNGMKQTVVGAMTGVIDSVKNAVSKVKDFVNGLISKANSVGSKIPGYKEIPKFADGVTNFSGGMAIVGEEGPELVNLPRGSDVIPNKDLAGMGGSNITVNQTNNIYSNLDLEQALSDIAFRVATAR